MNAYVHTYKRTIALSITQTSRLMYIGGLFSTLVDYERFCRCLLGGGVLGQVRVLSELAVQLMTSNHLPNNGFYYCYLVVAVVVAVVPFQPFCTFLAC